MPLLVLGNTMFDGCHWRLASAIPTGACSLLFQEIVARMWGHKRVYAEWALGTLTNKLRANQHWRDASGTL